MRLSDVYQFLEENPAYWDEDAYEGINWHAVPPRFRKRTERRMSAWRAFLKLRRAAAAAKLLDERRAYISDAVIPVYQKDPDGCIAGPKALVPYQGRKEYERELPLPQGSSEGFGYAGAFDQLLQRTYKDRTIEEWLNRFLDRSMKKLRGAPARPEAKTVHRLFKALLEKSGITRNEYPFDTATVAYNSLLAFIKAHRNAFYAAHNFHIPNWRHELGSDGDYRVFECGELDEHVCDQWPFAKTHKLNLVWTDGPHVRVIPLTRLSIIVEIDRRPHLALGFRLCERQRNNASMVVDTICAGTVPFERPENQSGPFSLPDGPAFASELGDALAWRGRASLKMDNDLTHYAKRTQQVCLLHHAMELNFGKKGAPKARGWIEGLFDKLEDLLRLLPGFTGKFPGDERGKRQAQVDPEGSLLVDQFSDAILAILAEHNTTPNAGLGGMSPIEFVAHNQARDNILSYFQIPAQNVEDCYLERCKVRVRLKDREPCFNCLNGRYFGAPLTPFVNQDLIAVIDRRDGRFATMYTLDGELLGQCTYRGALASRPHDVEERAKFATWARSDRLKREPTQDPFGQYMLEQLEEAESSTRAATRLLQSASRVGPEAQPSPEQVAAVESVDVDERYFSGSLGVKES